MAATVFPDGTGVVQEVPVHTPFRWSTSWVLLAAGFLFPVLWVACVLLPYFTKDVNDRRASLWAITAILLALLVVLAVVTMSM